MPPRVVHPRRAEPADGTAPSRSHGSRLKIPRVRGASPTQEKASHRLAAANPTLRAESSRFPRPSQDDTPLGYRSFAILKVTAVRAVFRQLYLSRIRGP